MVPSVKDIAMTRSPVGSYSVCAVVHAIATAARYQADRPVELDRVAVAAHGSMTRLRPGTFLDDVRFHGLRQAIAAIVARTPVPDVPAALDVLAADGVIDAVGHYFDGTIALTPAGVERALELRPQFTAQNLTTEWFDRFLTRDEYDRLVRHVASKTKHSRDESEIRGFVHGYVLSMSKNDGLRGRILADNDPTPSSIRAWVWKHVLSTFRNEGTDAQTRTVKGSRTEREVRGMGPPPDAYASPGVDTTVVYALEGGGEGDPGTFATSSASQGHALLDVVDASPTAEELLAHRDAMARGMARFEAAVRADKPGAAARYVRVLGHMARGLSPAEVAAVEGVSPARGATLVAEVRQAGRHRATKDRVRHDVVRYLESEPMSTLAELVDEISADRATVRDAVTELVTEGIVVWRKGGSLQVARDAGAAFDA